MLAIGALVALVALALSGAASPATGQEEPGTGLRTQRPEGLKQTKLDSRLAEVARAQKLGGQSAASAAAESQGLTVESGLVRMVVVARDATFAAASVRGSGGVIEASYAGNLQVLLPPVAIEPISASSQVAYVRPPSRSSTRGGGW